MADPVKMTEEDIKAAKKYDQAAQGANVLIEFRSIWSYVSRR